MMNIYKKMVGSKKLGKQKKITRGCWVNVIDPDNEEIDELNDKINIEKEYITDALDKNETPRIEKEDNIVFIIFKIPHIIKENMKFETYPLGVIMKDENIITICRYKNEVIRDFEIKKIKNFYTTKRVRFLLQLFLRSSQYYMNYLKDIENEIKKIEKSLSKRFSNEDIMKLTQLEKSLFYFNTACISNDKVMRKIVSGKVLELYHEDQELLEDILIENQQAIEMTSIYRHLITTMRDAYTSIVSNNLSDVMKFLTAITLVISIPTMIASFYGMNFQNIPFSGHPQGFILAVMASFAIGLVIALWLKNKRYL